jgi:single-stranded-DNA-specific exonuclease
MQARQWIIHDPLPPDRADGNALPPPLAAILWRRGLRDIDSIGRFLSPRLKDLSDPFLLPQMEEATDRILAAIEAGEPVALYGDYDADGVTSVAIVTRILRAYGLDPRPFLPHRVEEGYGISEAGLDRCLCENRPSLVIALDCGTSSSASIQWLRQKGIDAVVFDHHEIKGGLPACPTVNPKAGDGFHYLCTAGIAFKLGHALLKKRPLDGFDLKTCLDLAALGTVADIVPLVEDNRILVTRGLAELARTRWVGLRHLAEVAGVNPPYTSTDLGFRLGPRLNAAGRLGAAAAALDLLLCDDPGRARPLAAALDSKNRERQTLEHQIVQEAHAMIAGSFNPETDFAIVLGKEGWHPGVLGIVAARIARSFHRPTLVIGFDRDGNGKGSGRGIPGFSLVGALSGCSEQPAAFGGHEQAAGLSLSIARFEAFRAAFMEAARRALAVPPSPIIEIDGRLDFAHCTTGFLDAHERLQPYGTHNPQPIFFAPSAHPISPPRLLKEKHLSLSLSQNGGNHRAILFNRTADQIPEPPWDVAFRIARNVYRGNVGVSIQVEDLRTSRAP